MTENPSPPPLFIVALAIGVMLGILIYLVAGSIFGLGDIPGTL